MSIEGPSKAEIQCTDKDDGTLNISYKPTEPGYYIVNLKFADHHVEGSPFTVKVCIDFLAQIFVVYFEKFMLVLYSLISFFIFYCR